MSNFFKRLTGSLQMPEEELFEKEGKNETDQAQEVNEPVAPQEERSQRVEAKLEEEIESPRMEPDAPIEDEEMTIEDGPSLDSEDDEPATIAQLASAKRHSTKTLSSKLHVSKEKSEEELAPNIPEGQLAIDVYETPKEIIIKSTIAGVKPEDLDVGIEDNTVNIRGSRHNEEKVKGEDYFYQECYWGTFSRSVILPSEVDSDKTQASLKDGILTVRLPKILKEREKKIKIIV